MPSLSSTYRPKTFADVTGQDAIRETLRLEIETGRIGHAYLFSGQEELENNDGKNFRKSAQLHPPEKRGTGQCM